MKLLTTNTKLLKDKTYKTAGLALAPAKQSGRNVCPSSTQSCRDMCCLWTRGMTVQPQVRKAMINRTNFFFNDRKKFLSQLHKELKNHSKHENALARLNIASDLPMHKIDETLYTNYPNITFYAYTKIMSKAKDYALGKLPPNLHVTYSWNEKADPRKVNWLIKNGCNATVVMDTYYSPPRPMGELPKTLQIGTKVWPVVDGDITDARIPEVDGRGVVVGLRAKVSKAKKQQFIDSGFIVTGTGDNWRV